MRSALAPYYGQRIPVAARFAGQSKKGYAILEEVKTPGGVVPYAWVTWPGQAPRPGASVQFEANVYQYYAKGRGEFDYGLVNLRCEP